jgi:hypothetical protein
MLVANNKWSRWIFVFGFLKNACSNISKGRVIHKVSLRTAWFFAESLAENRGNRQAFRVGMILHL